MDARLLVLTAVVVAAAAGTTAVGGDDQVGDAEVYLKPADSSNGDAYAGVANGTLVVDVPDANPDAATIVDDLFLIAAGDLSGRAIAIWLDPESNVAFYRMDTGASVEGAANGVRLGSGDSVAVGLRIDADEPGVLLENVTVNVAAATASEPVAGADPRVLNATLLTPRVAPGDRVIASVTLANRGGVGTVHTVYLTVGGEVVATAHVELEAGERETVRLSHPVSQPGTLPIRVAGESLGTVTVTEVDGTPATTPVRPAAGDAEPWTGTGETETTESETPEPGTTEPASPSPTPSSETPSFAPLDVPAVGLTVSAVALLLAAAALELLRRRRQS